MDEIEIEFTGAADAADFDATVAVFDGFGRLFGEPSIGFTAEQETGVLVEALLVALDDYAYVLAKGKVELSGPARAVKNDENVRTAYLGI